MTVSVLCHDTGCSSDVSYLSCAASVARLGLCRLPLMGCDWGCRCCFARDRKVELECKKGGARTRDPLQAAASAAAQLIHTPLQQSNCLIRACTVLLLCAACCCRVQDLGFNASNMEVKLLIRQQVPEIAQVRALLRQPGSRRSRQTSPCLQASGLRPTKPRRPVLAAFRQLSGSTPCSLCM